MRHWQSRKCEGRFCKVQGWDFLKVTSRLNADAQERGPVGVKHGGNMLTGACIC
jgi:hypothetical protein